MLSGTSPGAGWCWEANVILFTVHVLSYLVSQCKCSLVKLACVGGVYLFPFKSSIE